MSRRILVLSASVGAGHLRAAEAVEAALCGNSTPTPRSRTSTCWN